MVNCRDCKHWHPDPKQASGTVRLCMRISGSDPTAYPYDDPRRSDLARTGGSWGGESALYVDEAFGCALGERRVPSVVTRFETETGATINLTLTEYRELVEFLASGSETAMTALKTATGRLVEDGAAARARRQGGAPPEP